MLWREVIIRAILDLFGVVGIEDRAEIIADAKEWFTDEEEQVRLVFERGGIDHVPVLAALKEVHAL